MNPTIRTPLMALLLSGLLLSVRAQEPLNPLIEAYIDMYRPLAIQEMQRTGVPAAIKIAQGILETEAGKSLLVHNSNNHFGIKCKSTWTGEKVYHDDDEKGECFRKYASPEDSYRDHSDYLRLQPRYASLFRFDPLDYKAWAHGLKLAGYATNPKYPDILIRLIETYQLDDITYFALHGQERQQQPRTDMVLTTPASEQRETGSTKSVTAPLVPDTGNGTSAASRQSYPEGIFYSEGTKAVYARKGTSILALAETHGIRLSKLLAYNGMAGGDNVLLEDRVIYLQRSRHREDINEQKNERWTPFKSMTGISSLISRRRS